METILFVTAFKDIGRGNWDNYKRDNQEYIKYFLQLANNINYKLIVFVEDDMMNLLNTVSLPYNIVLHDIKEVDTFLDRYIDREREIMSGEIYRNKIPPHRKTNPEHNFPEYTLINHSKINFVRYAKEKYTGYDYYSWLDFGCIRNTLRDIPNHINFYKLQNSIHYLALIRPRDRIDEDTMLASDTVYITGSQFVIHSSLVEEYEKIYEEKLINWQEKNICDDDQSLVLQLYYDKPSRFTLFYDTEWFSLFRKHLNNEHFELNTKEDFYKLLNARSPKGKYIEIGVARGNFSEYLATKTECEKLYLVDPYRNFSLEEYTDAMNNYDMEYEYQFCKNRMSKYEPRVEFVRKTSMEALGDFEDNSMDFVYIDGNHSYENTTEDLENYWNKVKVGGILAGDDFYELSDTKNKFYYWDNVNDINQSRSFGKYGVSNAVVDFCQKNNLRFYQFSNQFIIYKL